MADVVAISRARERLVEERLAIVRMLVTSSDAKARQQLVEVQACIDALDRAWEDATRPDPPPLDEKS